MVDQEYLGEFRPVSVIQQLKSYREVSTDGQVTTAKCASPISEGSCDVPCRGIIEYMQSQEITEGYIGVSAISNQQARLFFWSEANPQDLPYLETDTNTVSGGHNNLRVPARKGWFAAVRINIDKCPPGDFPITNVSLYKQGDKFMARFRDSEIAIPDNGNLWIKMYKESDQFSISTMSTNDNPTVELVSVVLIVVLAVVLLYFLLKNCY